MKIPPKIKLIAITTGIYPQSSAISQRHLALLRGLYENGVNVKLLSIYAEGVNVNKYFEYKNIHGEHLITNNSNKKSPLKKWLYNFAGIMILLARLLKLRRQNKVNASIIYVTKLFHLIPILIICKLSRIKTLHERTEFPFLMSKNNIIKTIEKYLYLKIILSKFQSIIVISSALENYLGKFNPNIIRIPIIVEPDRFEISVESRYSFAYLAYCGDLSFYKDGVDILLKGFSKIIIEFPKIKLVIIGDFEKSINKNKIISLVEDLRLKDNIVFTGKVSSEEVPGFLINSKALLLSRPDNIQARYGLPTKLGEYLLSGNPVVITSVGDIPQYLNSNQHALLAIPGDSDSFALEIKKILNNSTLAKKIGSNGKDVCLKEFHYLTLSLKLLKHIQNLF